MYLAHLVCEPSSARQAERPACHVPQLPRTARPRHQLCPALPRPACCVQATAFSELVLECLGRPGPDMAAHTLDYFLMANTGGVGGRGVGWGAGACATCPNASNACQLLA